MVRPGAPSAEVLRTVRRSAEKEWMPLRSVSWRKRARLSEDRASSVTETAPAPPRPVVLLRLSMFDRRPREATALETAVRRSSSTSAGRGIRPVPAACRSARYSPVTAARSSNRFFWSSLLARRSLPSLQREKAAPQARRARSSRRRARRSTPGRCRPFPGGRAWRRTGSVSRLFPPQGQGKSQSSAGDLLDVPQGSPEPPGISRRLEGLDGLHGLGRPCQLGTLAGVPHLVEDREAGFSSPVSAGPRPSEVAEKEGEGAVVPSASPKFRQFAPGLGEMVHDPLRRTGDLPVEGRRLGGNPLQGRTDLQGEVELNGAEDRPEKRGGGGKVSEDPGRPLPGESGFQGGREMFTERKAENGPQSAGLPPELARDVPVQTEAARLSRPEARANSLQRRTSRPYRRPLSDPGLPLPRCRTCRRGGPLRKIPPRR